MSLPTVNRDELVALLGRANAVFGDQARVIVEMLRQPDTILSQSPKMVATSRLLETYSGRAEYHRAREKPEVALDNLVTLFTHAPADTAWHVISLSQGARHAGIFVAADRSLIGCLLPVDPIDAGGGSR